MELLATLRSRRCADWPPSWHEDQIEPTSGLDPLQSIDDLAQYLGVPITMIYDWRAVAVKLQQYRQVKAFGVKYIGETAGSELASERGQA